MLARLSASNFNAFRVEQLWSFFPVGSRDKPTIQRVEEEDEKKTNTQYSNADTDMNGGCLNC